MNIFSKMNKNILRLYHYSNWNIVSFCFLAIAFLFLPGQIESNPADELKSGQTRLIENQSMTNWKGHDYAPKISPDGRYLIFQSDRPGRFEDQNLWFSENLNWPDTSGEARWSVPQTLFFPLSQQITKTMQVFRPSGTQIDPDGSYSINSDAFEGMASFIYRKHEIVEVYFTSIKNQKAQRDGYDGLNIYFTRFRDGRWSKVTHLNIINTNFDDRMPVVSNDGKKMYFVSNRPGGFGGSDIWYSERSLATGLWSTPVNAGAVFNTPYNEISPTLISRDQILAFSSDRPGGFGHFDLYFSRHNGINWELVKNLGVPFNSNRDDEYLSMTRDGLWTYLTSDRTHNDARGGYDIYRMKTPAWMLSLEKVLFIGNILDGATRLPLGISATIKILYEHETIVHSSKVRRKVDDSIDANNFSIKLATNREYRMIISAPGFYPRELRLSYKGPMPVAGVDKRTVLLQPIIQKELDPKFDYKSISGRVVNKATGRPIPTATIKMTASYIKEPMLLFVNKDGRFLVRVVNKKVFTLWASAPGFEDLKKTFAVRPELKNILLQMKRKGKHNPCEHLEIGCIDTSFVYFATNSSKIQKSEIEKLTRIIAILKQNLSVHILIAGHTDHRFTKEYNLRLSEDRARSVQKYLIAGGIDKKRLSVTGYGFLQPIIKTEKTENDRQKNRRVEFRVVKKP